MSQEFTSNTFTTSETSSWSISTVFVCPSTALVDFYGRSFVGILGPKQLQQRTYTGLPPHWSLSVRFDMIIYATYDAPDYTTVNIDSVGYGTYTKAWDAGILKMCGDTYSDEFFLYSKNITHTSSSVTIMLNVFTDELNEGTLFKNFFLYVDTCDPTCLTCSGPAYVMIRFLLLFSF